jgi:hypothetical protein
MARVCTTASCREEGVKVVCTVLANVFSYNHLGQKSSQCSLLILSRVANSIIKDSCLCWMQTSKDTREV